jgi:hypothetical protein
MINTVIIMIMIIIIILVWQIKAEKVREVMHSQIVSEARLKDVFQMDWLRMHGHGMLDALVKDPHEQEVGSTHKHMKHTVYVSMMHISDLVPHTNAVHNSGEEFDARHTTRCARERAEECSPNVPPRHTRCGRCCWSTTTCSRSCSGRSPPYI